MKTFFIMRLVKKIYALTLLLILWNSLPVARPNGIQPEIITHLQAQSGAPESGESSIALLKMLLSILTCELIALSADDQSKLILHEQYSGYNLLKNFADNYGSQLATTFCHELGHALAAKIINGDPIDIHLGGNASSGKPILSIGGISLDGFDPRKGYSSHTAPHDNPTQVHAALDELVQAAGDFPANTPKQDTPQKNIQELVSQLRRSPAFQNLRKNIVQVNRKKQAVILLAGGIGGLIGRFATKAITHLVTHRDEIGRLSFKESCSQAAAHALTPDHIYMNQLINMLVPFHVEGGQSDATKFWDECVGINSEVIKAIQSLAPGVEFGGEFYLAHAQAVSPYADTKTKALIALLNYLSGGLVHVHV